jgi:hypothetical protein
MRTAWCCNAVIAAGLLGCAVPGWAIDGHADTLQEREPQPGPQDEIGYKFTPTYYHTTNVTPAYDLNLRGTRAGHTA